MTDKNISIIVAVSENNAIGKDNKLLWHLSDDLKRFKKITNGHKIIMGRNTFLSLPNGLLPNRIHIVITDIPGEKFDGCIMANSIEEAIQHVDNNEEVFVVGGGMIYKQFLPLASRLYLTIVHINIEGDTYLDIHMEGWNKTHSEEVDASEKNDYPHTFMILERV